MDDELDAGAAPADVNDEIDEAAAEPSGADASASPEPPDYEQLIAERDARIGELEARLGEAVRSAEVAEELRGEIAELKAKSESDRTDFALTLAGCRSVKAARAVLGDYGGDVAALKAGEPWLFARHMGETGGTTGLPSAGAAADEGAVLRHYREVAGLE